MNYEVPDFFPSASTGRNLSEEELRWMIEGIKLALKVCRSIAGDIHPIERVGLDRACRVLGEWAGQ